ncbi:hypothetical protein Bbelb_440130 [Branchiostoma belcheri]|nr:hypothetical protein Bbelb_440130 [Branchiostoma belcheri]
MLSDRPHVHPGGGMPTTWVRPTHCDCVGQDSDHVSPPVCRPRLPVGSPVSPARRYSCMGYCWTERERGQSSTHGLRRALTCPPKGIPSPNPLPGPHRIPGGNKPGPHSILQYTGTPHSHFTTLRRSLHNARLATVQSRLSGVTCERLDQTNNPTTCGDRYTPHDGLEERCQSGWHPGYRNWSCTGPTWMIPESSSVAGLAEDDGDVSKATVTHSEPSPEHRPTKDVTDRLAEAREQSDQI